MRNEEAVKVIRQFIERERTWRKRVFRDGRASQLEGKLRECDGAEAALDLLAERLAVASEPAAKTLPLFG